MNALSHDNQQFDAFDQVETNPIFKKNIFNSEESEFSIMRILVRKPDGWHPFNLNQGQNRITIGNANTCNIILNDPNSSDVQLIMTRMGNQWYLIEIGSNQITSFNGLTKRQCVLKLHNNCLMRVGDTEFILVSFPSNSHFPAATASSSTAGFDYVVMNNGIAHTHYSRKTALIGSASECDLRVPGEPFAGVISAYKKNLFFTPVGYGAGIELLGQVKSFHGAYLLSDENDIIINGHELRLVRNSKMDRSQYHVLPDFSDTRLCLVETMRDKLEEKRYLLPQAGHTVAIGRTRSCDICMEDNTVSRRHAQLLIYDHAALVVDCGSSNGVFVNSEKVQKTLAHPGDLIEIGDHAMILCYAD